MIKTTNFQDFCDHFSQFSEGYRDKFSYNGKRALFDYLEDYEEQTGEKIELDVIVLCCEYTEYESAIEACEQYDTILTDDIDNVTKEQQSILWLQDRTQVIEFDGGIIIQNF